jgi:hypothetical protein
MIAFLAITSSIFAQSQNTGSFHYVIKPNKLNRKYKLVYIVGSNRKVGGVRTLTDTLVVKKGNVWGKHKGDFYYLDSLGFGTERNKLKCTITQGKNGILVDIWGFPSPTPTFFYPSANISSRTPVSDTQYFMFPFTPKTNLGVVNEYVTVGFRSWTLSAGISALRYRPKQDSASASGSALSMISFNYGRTWGFSRINVKRITNYSITGAVFGGLSAAELKETTVKRPVWWKKSESVSRTNPVISYGVSAILSRNNLGLVFSLGWDCNIGPNAKEWAYQSKPWFGVGVSASLGFF